ncbi:bifunctional diguanylate cyclase/phosphodiesterase [Chitinimonas sp. BJYL2]|uniref:putative bifunctional diguanylate cyclase/phosphodiesterase n=1 Tax=Chitinimonas sp. BJYL2 TaxID=2976696 RepID=UPI0022B376F7|nr:bifunctional diguanylate cyclase/phosphodiesterase [Chitinimonas sp. BJYL2]
MRADGRSVPALFLRPIASNLSKKRRTTKRKTSGNHKLDTAGIDPLTGFLDRQGCLRDAERLVARSRREERPLSAVWVNLDRFRQINGSLGLGGGDAVIAKMAERLHGRFAHRVHLARMGSDEFVMLAPDLSLDEAQLMGNEAQQLIGMPMEVGSIYLHPSCSGGVAHLEYAEEAEHLLQRAEHAMHEAKRQGGARIVMSGEEATPGRLGIKLAREELDVEHKLHAALEVGGLYLHYQPIVRFDGKVEAVEALMRCELDGEMVPPVKFIPVAEKTGLVIRLGEWSLMQGAMQARRLADLGTPTKVAINVSRAQLTAPKFSQALYAALLCSDVDPALIELEITESLFMDVSERVQANLRAATAMGVSLSIDDFGTGYSCLATLKDIPAGKLKLDRAFVVPLPDDARVYAVVKAISQLGRELGMTVVAEGVESMTQSDALQAAGVDAIQGYMHARPMSGDAVAAWLARQHELTVRPM